MKRSERHKHTVTTASYQKNGTASAMRRAFPSARSRWSGRRKAPRKSREPWRVEGAHSEARVFTPRLHSGTRSDGGGGEEGC